MKITRRQLKRIIREAIEDADDTEKINAMLGFIQEYTVADQIDVQARLKRALKMADLTKQLVSGRKKGKLPKFSGKEQKYAKIIVDDLEGPSKEDWERLVELGKTIIDAK